MTDAAGSSSDGVVPEMRTGERRRGHGAHWNSLSINCAPCYHLSLGENATCRLCRKAGALVTTLEYVLPQFPLIIPKLLLFLVGAMCSLAQLKRVGTPVRLALVGCVTVSVVTFVFPFVQGYLVTQQVRAAELSTLMGIAGIIRVALEVIGLSLILSAVFAGRDAPAGRESAK